MQGGRGGNFDIRELNNEIQATEDYLNNLYQWRDSMTGNQGGGGGGNFGRTGSQSNFSSRGRGSNQSQQLFRRQYHSNQPDAGYDYVEHSQGNTDVTDMGIRHQNLPTFGPRSGFAPGGRRAFSAIRDGNFGRGGVPIDKEGTIDERTKEGRLATDAEGWSEQELYQALDQAPRNKDGSIDLRTEEGRALVAAHFVDDQGNILVDQQGMQGGQNRGGNRGGSQSRDNRS